MGFSSRSAFRQILSMVLPSILGKYEKDQSSIHGVWTFQRFVFWSLPTDSSPPMVGEREEVEEEGHLTTSEAVAVIMTLEAHLRRRYLELLVWITPSLPRFLKPASHVMDR